MREVISVNATQKAFAILPAVAAPIANENKSKRMFSLVSPNVCRDPLSGV